MTFVCSREETLQATRSARGAPHDAEVSCVSLGTKAESLERIAPLLTTAVCLPQIFFTVDDWQRDRAGITRAVCSAFGQKALAVRSSALSEDTEKNSNAGAFCSIIGVAASAARIETAVERVIASYDKPNPRNQVLVQPQLRGVALSGVVLTRDLQHGAPYFVISVESSGGTTGITSGTACGATTTYLRRDAPVPQTPAFLQPIVDMARELELLTGLDALDIEFAIDSNLTAYLLQVRPIAEIESRLPEPACEGMLLEEVRAVIGSCEERAQGLAGRRALLSDMSDWNPAELIGSHPSPLARSLFEFLVTDAAWREGRAQLGYFEPTGKSLLVVLAGRPYIDIRNSFNSLLPAALPGKLRESVIDEAMDHLELNPYLHDKVEFEVLTSCYTPSFDLREDRFKSAGLTSGEIADLKSVLRDHTEALVRGDFRSLPSLMSELAEMDAVRASPLDFDAVGHTLSRVRDLLTDCRRRGATSFASVARLAFVGNALLRSLIEIGAVSTQRADAFLRSFTTVATEMTAALAATRNRTLPLEEFLSQYGHLRPGTFDISSPRYDEDPGRYFATTGGNLQGASEDHPKAQFRWTEAEIADISRVLEASGLRLGAREVLAFVQEAVVAREKAKFLFTKNLSDALHLLAEWGRSQNLSRRTLSYLHIDQLLALMDEVVLRDRDAVERTAREAAARHAHERQLILPELIANASSLDHFRFNTNRPTFVTDGHVIAPVQLLSSDSHPPELNGKVVLIESADPGYDWILGHDIRGLITKYGGTASHMAIRCAEFSLPAAIGVGNTFENLRRADVVELDCINHVVRSAT